MTSKRQGLLDAIAAQISDYQQGFGEPRTPKRIDDWAKQFDEAVQEPILAEMVHVLERQYISKQTFENGLRGMVTASNLVKPTPKEFWQRANFLWIQKKGSSQAVMRKLFTAALKAETGLNIDKCGSPDGPYFYLDDGVFTATHVRWDLIDWVKTDAPKKAVVNVLALAIHDGRIGYTSTEVAKQAKALGKDIKIEGWWRAVGIPEQEGFGEETAVLKPRSFPDDDPHVAKLLKSLKDHPPRPRRVLTTSKNPVFSSEEARVLLEQEFLKAGARIKYELCKQLPANAWPLGYDVFKGPGFGSMLVTYRNCPNNCPLALWAGSPWIPLFPRESNPSYQNFDPSVFDDETV
jgi:hypothetical protein